MSQEDDLRLLKGCLEGSPEAWEAFHARFRPYLAQVCRRVMAGCGLNRGPDEVRDMVQDVFMALLDQDMRTLRAYRGEASLAGYLAGVAVKRVLDCRNQSRSSVPFPSLEPPSRAPGPEAQALRRETLDRLDAEVAELSAREQMAVALHGKGASRKEIGLVLGLSEGAASMLLSRAIARLKEDLRDA